MDREYLTIKEVSDYLKLPEETVYKYARGGRIPASKVGRYWRFEREAIDAWVTEHSNMVKRNIQILVIDDEPVIRGLIGKWMDQLGCGATVTSSGEEGLAQIRSTSFDLVLLDLNMPTLNGVETLKQIRATAPDLPVVIMTAYFESKLMDDALDLGPLTILRKPLARERVEALVASVRQKAAVN